MRDEKEIQIKGSVQKKKLRYMGYFHGYKGYRYHNSPANIFNFSSFNEIRAVYDFDMLLKTMFYPKIMFLETTLKNYVLEVILDTTKSKRFADIYAKLLTDYKSYSVGSSNYKKAALEGETKVNLVTIIREIKYFQKNRDDRGRVHRFV